FVKTLKLDKDDLSILKKEKYTSVNFLKITEEKLCGDGLRGGSAERLANFAKKYSEWKRHKYSSIKSFKDVLKDYSIDSDNISKIPLFEPQIHDIKDNDKYFQNCIIGSDSIFKMDVEYEANKDKIDRSIQKGIAQNIRQLESSHDVNKKTQEWYFLLHNSEKISISNAAPFIIQYREKAWDKESDEYKNLCKNTKKVLSIIAGLLLDKVDNIELEAKRKK
ncbi:24342_t:CDS:2, partial [Gigaspora margarita]